MASFWLKPSRVLGVSLPWQDKVITQNHVFMLLSSQVFEKLEVLGHEPAYSDDWTPSDLIRKSWSQANTVAEIHLHTLVQRHLATWRCRTEPRFVLTQYAPYWYCAVTSCLLNVRAMLLWRWLSWVHDAGAFGWIFWWLTVTSVGLGIMIGDLTLRVHDMRRRYAVVEYRFWIRRVRKFETSVARWFLSHVWRVESDLGYWWSGEEYLRWTRLLGTVNMHVNLRLWVTTLHNGPRASIRKAGPGLGSLHILEGTVVELP